MTQKVVIASDIHSNIDALKFIIDVCKEEKATLLLIAGDLEPSSLEFSILLQNAPCRYVCVRGNCDNLWSFKDYSLVSPPLYTLQEYNGRNIFIYHGHYYIEPPISLNRGDIIVNGHTHVPLLQNRDGIIYLNPGSLAKPRNIEGATYAIIYDDVIEIRKTNHKVIKSLKLN